MEHQSDTNSVSKSKNEDTSAKSNDSISLSPELSDALNSVDPQHREVIVHYIRQTSLSSYSGPLPPPEVLSGYENVKEGFAERILVLAEK